MEVVLVALIGSVVGPSVLWLLQRQTRIEEKQDRAEVAGLVAKVAVKAERTDKKLDEIAATSEGIHTLVNSGRTEMLRQIAVLARVVADSQPDNAAAQKAAAAAEANVEQNEIANATAAQEKLDRQKGSVSSEYARAEKARRGDA